MSSNILFTIFIIVISVNYCMMSSSSLKMDPRIIIVGGGVSGIAAAARLIEKGFQNIKILEADNRYGGRILTVPFGANVVDIGAQWCHGEKNNAVFQLAKPYNLLGIDADTEDWILTKPNGQNLPIDSVNRLMNVLEPIEDDYWRELGAFKGSMGDFIIMKYYQIVNTPKYASISKEVKAQVLEYYGRFTNIDSSADSWFNVFAPGELEYWECEGNPNLNWKDKGYATIFKLLTKSYPTPNTNSIKVEDKILLNRQVSEISYNNPSNDDFVTVETENGETHEARHVIVTVSLGVLKATHNSLFSPKLSKSKINAIQGLGFGVMDKLFLEFDKPFWSEGFDGLNIVWTDAELAAIRKRPDSYIEGIVAFELVSFQPNLLLGWITGDAARRMEAADEDEVKEGCMFILRKFLPSLTVPEPKTFRRTAWYSNENTRGVYSYRSVTSEKMKATAKQLAEPIMNSKNKPVVTFAGEATHDHYYSTVHGAIESGWREADRIAKLYL